MTLNLSEIDERLKFVDAEIAAFATELSPWLLENTDLDVVESGPHTWVIHGRMKGEIPASFRIRVGQYVHTLRSALDSVACALALNHSGSEESTYFPISKSKAVFDTDGQRKIKLLSPADKTKIESLTPYKEANSTLYALHQLDLIDKHRRLALHATVVKPHLEGYIVYAYINSPTLTKERTYIGTVSMQNDVLQISRRLVFCEPETAINGKGVVLQLMEFSQEVSRVTNIFR